MSNRFDASPSLELAAPLVSGRGSTARETTPKLDCFMFTLLIAPTEVSFMQSNTEPKEEQSGDTVLMVLSRKAVRTLNRPNR